MKIPIVHSRPVVPLIIPAAALCFAANAAAMVVVERDFPALVERAEQIITGTVTDVREGVVDGAPITFVTVSSLTVMKGDAGDSITLELYGGGDGEYAAKVPDMPTFTPGEDVLLFIAGNGENVSPIVGVWQGTFRIRSDETFGARIVTSNGGTPITAIVDGKIELATPGGDGGGAAAPMTLDALRQEIADELANPSGNGTR